MTEPAGPVPRRASLLAVAGMMAAAASGLAAWSGGFGARVNGEDLYVAFLPQQRYVAESLRAGHFPLWNPYEFCGLPLLGVAQASALYAPVVLANLLLPPVQAMRVLYDLHLAAFVLLVLWYLARAGIGLAAGAAGAAIAVACFFNGVALLGIDHPHVFFAALFLPAILLAWDALLAGERRAAAVVALSAGLQWLPCYPEVPVETAVFLVIIASLGPGPGRLRRIPLAVALLALGALVAAAQILPLAETVAESVRAEEAQYFPRIREQLFAFDGLGQLVGVVLDRYGVAAVYLALLGVLVPSRWRAAWALAFLWCTFPANRPFSYLYAVPPFSGFRFAFGWNTLAPFFAGCLAAAGLDGLRRAAPPLRAWVAPAVGLGLAALALGYGHRVEAAVALVCAASALPLLRARGASAVPLLLVLVHAGTIMGRIGTMPRQPAPDTRALAPRADALRAVREALPGEPRVLAGPELRNGLIMPARIPSPNGYEPALAPQRIARLGKHLGLNHFSWGGENLMNAWAQLAASPGAARALGIGLVAATPLQARPLLASGYVVQSRLPDGNLALYQAAPGRFHVVHTVARAADEEDAFRRVTDPAFDPRATVVLEGDAVPDLTPGGGAGDEVTVVGEAPERIRLGTRLGMAGVLVVADTYFPDWVARVDGRPSPILRANYALRALVLAAGAHDVELAYRPRSFRIGVALSLVGLALVAALWWSAAAPDHGAWRFDARPASGSGPS